MFLELKIDAQHCVGLLQPVPERGRLNICLVQPISQPGDDITERFSREPNLDDVKHPEAHAAGPGNSS